MSATEIRAQLASETETLNKLLQWHVHKLDLAPEQAEKFRSVISRSLTRNDYAPLRSFRGDSSFRSFLTVITHRFALDYKNASSQP